MVMFLAVGFTTAQTTSKPLYDSPAIGEKGYQIEQSSTEQASELPVTLPHIPNPFPISHLRRDKNAILSVQTNDHSKNVTSLVVGGMRLLKFENNVPNIVVNSPGILHASPISGNEILLWGADAKGETTTLTAIDDKENAIEITVNVVKTLKKEAGKHSDKNIRVVEGTTKRLTFDYKIPEIMVENPEVVSVSPVSATEIVVSAKGVGSSIVHVSGINGENEQITIRVVPKIQERVIAINVRIYEVSRTKLRNLGVDFTKAGFPGNINSLTQVLNPERKDLPVGFKLLKDQSFEPFVDEMEKRAIARLLDQPTLVAMHGRPVEFLSGGEVPVPFQDENGNAQVKFEALGTKLVINPIIQSESELILQIQSELSTLNKKHEELTGGPGFFRRGIETGVKMKPGQTFALVIENPGFDTDEKEGDVEYVFMITPRLLDVAAPKQ